MSRIDVSLAAHRVLLLLAAQLNAMRPSAFAVQRLSDSDLVSHAGFRPAKVTRAVEHAASCLGEARVALPVSPSPGSGREARTRLPLFERIVYDARGSVLEARFHEAMRPYLLALGDATPASSLAHALAFPTTTALRHYLMGRMIQHASPHGEYALSLDAYRAWLPEAAVHADVHALKRRVIVPAVRAVNRRVHMGMCFEVTRNKAGPTGITFHVKPRSRASPSAEAPTASAGPTGGTVCVLRALATERGDTSGNERSTEEAARSTWHVGFTTEGAEAYRAAQQAATAVPLRVFWTIRSRNARALADVLRQRLEPFRRPGPSARPDAFADAAFCLSENRMLRLLLDLQAQADRS